MGLQTHQDVSSDLNKHNIQKNIKHLKKFSETFEQFINPFSSKVPKDHLINISSSRFEKSIKRTALNNFSKDLEKKKNIKIGGAFEKGKNLTSFVWPYAGSRWITMWISQKFCHTQSPMCLNLCVI